MSDNYVWVSIESGEPGSKDHDVDTWYACRPMPMAWADNNGELQEISDSGWRIEGSDLSVSNIASIMGLRLLLDEIELKILEAERGEHPPSDPRAIGE